VERVLTDKDAAALSAETLHAHFHDSLLAAPLRVKPSIHHNAKPDKKYQQDNQAE